MSREVQRARVLYSNDPLQLNAAQEPWACSPHSSKSLVKQDWPELANAGKWKQIAQETANFQLEPPEKLLQAATWHVIAQIQLGEIQGASQSLSILGDLNAPEFSKSTPQGQVSKVPFALRRAVCQCQANFGPQEGQDALYSLLEHCQQRSEGNKGDVEVQNLWRWREESVAASIFCHHYRHKEFDAAKNWLHWLFQRHPEDINLLLTIGYVYLSLGQTHSAIQILKNAVKMAEERGEAEFYTQKFRHFQGLLLLAQNNMPGAIEEFQAIATENPGDHITINNLAMCQVYSGNLASASKMLESSLQKNWEEMMHQTVIDNLAIMYDLLGVQSAQESKRKLGDWLNKIGPQNLDLSSLE